MQWLYPLSLLVSLFYQSETTYLLLSARRMRRNLVEEQYERVSFRYLGGKLEP